MLVLVAGVAFSGGSSVDPPPPRGFPGVVPAFMAKSENPPAGGAKADRGLAAQAASRRDRRWLARARRLGPAAPRWARAMYRRSLLVLRALVDRRGAAIAGARSGWAYVWPRDAGAVAIALASAGYGADARRIARFLLELDLDAAARFYRSGEPVEGRGAQGDAAGWVAAAARAAGMQPGRDIGVETRPASGAPLGLGAGAWRDRADYQEGDAGDYLGNGLATASVEIQGSAASHLSAPQIKREFETGRGLVRAAGDPASGLDSAAAWAVRPFARPVLYPAVRRTLLRLVAERRTHFGLIPSEGWHGGDDPWTAPTAWCAWSLAALWRIDRRAGRRREAATERRAALGLMADLRRAATPLGLLPERVDAQTGAPASTTPLAWSHAFAVLAIRELWPDARSPASTASAPTPRPYAAVR
ncbi:MAG TPA: hypothetical protein VFG58_00860 [Solirubrobacterales bacterium]|nr:hypothetical protein [Solirubrobacterales bacterium]